MTAPKGKRCGCRDANGKPLGSRCPKLRQRHHGTYEAELRIDTSKGREKLHRGGFATAKDKDEFVSQVRDLIRLADGDRATAAEIGDLIWKSTKYGGQLPATEDVRRRLALGRGLAECETLAEWLEAWHASKRSLRESSARAYRGHMDVWLIPHLGHIRLDRLTSAHIAAMFETISKWNAEIELAAAEKRKPVLPGDSRPYPRVTGITTQHRIFATLRNALSAAVRQRRIAYNPCAGVELPPETRDPAQVWSPEQVATFLHESAADRIAVLYRLVLVRGLRRREACEIKWADVDLTNAELRIPRSKTKAGVRTVSLDPATVTMLKAHRKRQAAERLAAFGAYEDQGLVFAHEDGSAIRPDYVSKHFATLTASARLPRITLHQGRHTAASLALEAGLDIKIVSEQMGHSTTRITQDLYQHVRRSVAGDAAARVARLIDPEAGRP